MTETFPELARKQHHRGVDQAVALALSFVAIFALHRHMQAAVLRAETGFYQVIAHSSPEHQRTFLRNFWKKSSHGHYTPLAFTAEYFFAKYVGPTPKLVAESTAFSGGFADLRFVRIHSSGRGEDPRASSC